MGQAYPDINLIGNLWSIIKRDVYENRKQYPRKEDCWEEKTQQTTNSSNIIVKIIEWLTK